MKKMIFGFLGTMALVVIAWIVLPILHVTIWRGGRKFDLCLSNFFPEMPKFKWHYEIGDVFWSFLAGIVKWVIFYPLARGNFFWQKLVLQKNVSW